MIKENILKLDSWIDIPFYKGYKINPYLRKVIGPRNKEIKIHNRDEVRFFVNNKGKSHNINKVLYAIQYELDLLKIPQKTSIKIINFKFYVKDSQIAASRKGNYLKKIANKYDKTDLIDKYREKIVFYHNMIEALNTGNYSVIVDEIYKLERKSISVFMKRYFWSFERSSFVFEIAKDELIKRIQEGYFILDFENWLRAFMRHYLLNAREYKEVPYVDDVNKDKMLSHGA